MNGDNCIRIEDCGCFMENETDGERGVLLKEGGIYVSPNCDKKCSCTDNHLSCADSYQCDPNADCEERNGLLQCYCPPGYSGYGIQCRPPVLSDCNELYNIGVRTSGVYEIKPTNWLDSSFEVYCNMSDGGGWTVFQRRVDALQDFYLYWDDYKIGFGNQSRNFWLGNEKIHSLTNQRQYELRIDFVDKDGDPYYAKYDFFRISEGNDNFRLDVGNYSDGDAGDSLTDHDDQLFTTRDNDNDDYDYSDYSSEKTT
ncbi:ryncolin-1-like [Apostichopus japonicus]|uniref:ryncolin-1-like n=1 Tax=Stichopus japonicus TaxID=307972 RepID=UPI003AB8D703